jgi:hypothetical protein
MPKTGGKKPELKLKLAGNWDGGSGTKQQQFECKDRDAPGMPGKNGESVLRASRPATGLQHEEYEPHT